MKKIKLFIMLVLLSTSIFGTYTLKIENTLLNKATVTIKAPSNISSAEGYHELMIPSKATEEIKYEKQEALISEIKVKIERGGTTVSIFKQPKEGILNFKILGTTRNPKLQQK